MRRLPAVVAGALLIGGSVLGISVLGGAAPAQAHNYLVSSTPAAGSTLTELPTAFEITTNDNLLELAGAGNGFVLQVVDSAGLFYGDGCVTVAGASMTAPAALGAAGDYTIRWQVISADGHSVSDEYTFTWAPASDQAVSVGSATAPVCGEATSTPSAVASPGATSTPTPEASAVTPPVAEPENTLDDALWIGGAVVALAVAVVVTLLITGRRKKP